MKMKCGLLMMLGAIMLGAASCAGGKSSDTHQSSSAVVENFEIKESIKSVTKNYLCEGADAYFNDSLKIYSTVKLTVQWPEKLGSYDIAVLQDSLKKMLSDKPAKTIDDTMIASVDSPEGSDIFTMTPIDTVPTDKPSMNYLRQTSASVLSLNPDYVVYEIETYCYEGGAHGNHEARYVTYDLNNGEVITSDNAFLPGSEPKLLDAIKNALMSRYSASSMKELQERGIFTDQLFVSKNFYLDGYEVVFHYNPYDIGPYVLGSVDVSVPYYEIDNVLTPIVKTLLTRDSQ